MAGHARLRRRNAREIALFHRSVAITAIDTELRNVMAMAEGDGLFTHDTSLRHVRRALDDAENPQQPADKKHRAKNADFGKGIRTRMKNLRHGKNLFGEITATKHFVADGN